MSVHVSHAYMKIDITREHIRRIFNLGVMVRYLQTIFRLNNATVASAIMESTSGLGPSSLMIAHKYLKLCTSSRVFHAIWTSVIMPLLLIVMSFVFSPLISIR